MHLQLKNFSGIIPKISPRLLPENAAVVSESTDLYSGEIRGLKVPTFVRTVGDDARRAFNAYIKDNEPTSPTKGEYVPVWVVFDDITVSFYRGPTVNDTYQRHYWSGENTSPSVVDGNQLLEFDGDLSLCDVWVWGIPNPVTVPSVAAATGSEPNVETRSYVFTFVNEWGEESGPSFASEPRTGDSTPGAAWTITNLQQSYPTSKLFNPLEFIRIYRTIVGDNTVSFRLVDEVPATLSSTYVDTISSDEVSLNEALDTTLYAPPLGAMDATVAEPNDGNIEGLVQLPNGMFAAFNGTDVYYSQPYRPYAFPPTYVISTGANVIGLGVYHSGLIVCTDSNPKVLSGASPLNMTMIDIDQHEPCLSARSIVSSHDGVYYVSKNGLVQVTEAGASLVTQQFVSSPEWQQMLVPENVQGAVSSQGYVGIQSQSEGFLLGPEIGNRAMISIGRLSYIKSIQNDARTAEVYIIRNGQLFRWNPARGVAMAYKWESKTFETPYPLNFGAFTIKWEAPRTYTNVVDEVTDYTYWNEHVWNYGALQTYDQFSYNSNTIPPPLGPKVDTAAFPPDEYYPLIPSITWGGSELITEETPDLSDGVLVTVYAKLKNEKEFRTVYSRYVTSESQQRLPSGFKADLWRIEMQSSADVYSLTIAETGRELAKV